MCKHLTTTTLFVSLALFSGCTIQQPTFEGSNQKVLENSMQAIDAGSKLKNQLPSGAHVALRSMEQKSTLDQPIDSMVQDLTVQSLISNGFRTYERDEDALANLQLEDHKFLKVEEKGHSIINDLDIEKLHLDSMQTLTMPDETLVSSPFKSADYLISYRVLEAGITYHSLNDGFQWEDLKDTRWWFPWYYPDEIERETMIRLHLRAIKTKTGEIVYADNLMSINNEILEKGLSKKLKDYHYDFFSSGTPVQETLEKEQSLKKEESLKIPSLFKLLQPKKEKAEKKKETISFDILFGLDNTYAMMAGYEFSFGKLQAQYQLASVDDTSVSTNTMIFYTYSISFLQLHAGYNFGSTSSLISNYDYTIGEYVTPDPITTSNLAYGLSVELLDFLNLKANYFYYNDMQSNLSISAGLSF